MRRVHLQDECFQLYLDVFAQRKRDRLTVSLARLFRGRSAAQPGQTMKTIAN